MARYLLKSLKEVDGKSTWPMHHDIYLIWECYEYDKIKMEFLRCSLIWNVTYKKWFLTLRVVKFVLHENVLAIRRQILIEICCIKREAR